MILNKQGESYIIDGINFIVGMKILAKNCNYEGLEGKIIEIRDGEDKDTENETSDIYCSFNALNNPDRIKRLEEIFSDLYGKPKTIEDNAVIMAPDMIIPTINNERGAL